MSGRPNPRGGRLCPPTRNRRDPHRLPLLTRRVRVGGRTVRPIDVAAALLLVALMFAIAFVPPGWWMGWSW